MDSNRLERKKRIERNRKRRLYRNVNNLMYAGIFVMAAIITIAAAVSRNNKIEYVDTAQMASTESIRVNNSNTDKVAAKAEETTKKSKKKVVTGNLLHTHDVVNIADINSVLLASDHYDNILF